MYNTRKRAQCVTPSEVYPVCVLLALGAHMSGEGASAVLISQVASDASLLRQAGEQSSPQLCRPSVGLSTLMSVTRIWGNVKSQSGNDRTED